MINAVELTNWLKHRHLEVQLTPLTLVCGPNGAGKSSIKNAINYTILADPGRITAKADRPLLLTEGTSDGMVTIQCGPVSLSRDIKTGKLDASGPLPFPEGAITAAARYLLSPEQFPKEDDDQKRRFLLDLARVDTSGPAILSLLRKRKHQEELIKALEDSPDSSIQAWQRLADQGATAARGAWRGITGETYGAKKAEGWAPESARQVPPSEEELAALSETILSAEEELANLNRTIGADEAKRTDAERIRRENASVLAEMERLAEAKAALEMIDLPSLELAANQAAATLRDLDSRRPQENLECPHCRSLLNFRDGQLHETSPLINPAQDYEVIEAGRENEKASAELSQARKEAQRLRAYIDARQDLQTRIQAEPDAPAAARATESLDAAKARLQASRQALADATKRRDAVTWGLQKAEQAATEHANIKAWLRLQEALAPAGIPAELLTRGLLAINTALAATAAEARWPAVMIREDMVITYGGRLFNLCSESEQWRVEAILAVTFAELSGLGMVILDRFDVLEVSARTPALSWLYRLSKGRLSTILVLGTLKEPPRVPVDVQVVWLGEERQPQQVAA